MIKVKRSNQYLILRFVQIVCIQKKYNWLMVLLGMVFTILLCIFNLFTQNIKTSKNFINLLNFFFNFSVAKIQSPIRLLHIKFNPCTSNSMQGCTNLIWNLSRIPKNVYRDWPYLIIFVIYFSKKKKNGYKFNAMKSVISYLLNEPLLSLALLILLILLQRVRLFNILQFVYAKTCYKHFDHWRSHLVKVNIA